MDWLQSVLRFLDSYPVWAKVCAVGGVLFSALVLLFAPRHGSSAETQTPRATQAPGAVFLRIRRVILFPEDPEAEVQVLAIVNGTTYRHPSIGGIEWMKVGPDMSEKLIELPPASRYDVRFEMKLRHSKQPAQGQPRQLAASPSQRAASQQVAWITHLPFSGDYKLYDVEGTTRAAMVRALVAYEVTENR